MDFSSARHVDFNKSHLKQLSISFYNLNWKSKNFMTVACTVSNVVVLVLRNGVSITLRITQNTVKLFLNCLNTLAEVLCVSCYFELLHVRYYDLLIKHIFAPRTVFCYFKLKTMDEFNLVKNSPENNYFSGKYQPLILSYIL